MSQSPSVPRITDSDHGYAEAWTHVNDLLLEGHSFSGREKNCCFLNLGDERFANVSSLFGFDFPDDGRGLAVTDWDQDGDLDIWMTNRTAPRVRFLQNNLPRQNFLRLHLKGSTQQCNRDAIGARAELHIAGNDNILIRSLRAGEGYLSQSSKVLHFGLGTATEIDSLTICWPDGEVEAISPPPSINASYEIKQGASRATFISNREKVNLLASTEPLQSHGGVQTANLLTQRIPLPPLSFLTLENQSVDVTQAGPPRLVNLWSRSCPACLHEISEWTAHQENLAASGLEVTLLNADVISADSRIDPAEIAKIIAQLNIPFNCGMATESFFEKLQLVHDEIYDHHRPLPLPTSLLLDSKGHLAAIYKGVVSTERVLQDVSKLKLTGDELVTAALPSKGIWIASPGPHRLSRIAERLFEEGFDDDAIAFASRLDGISKHQHQAAIICQQGIQLARAENIAAAEVKFQKALALDPNSMIAHRELGTIYGRKNDLPLAVKHLSKAVQFDNEGTPDAYVNLGVALRRMGKNAEAVVALERAIEIDPQLAAAYENLALISGRHGRLEKSIEYFQQAIQIEPSKIQNRINLAIAMKQTGRDQDALEQLKLVLDVDPDMPIAVTHTCQILNDLGRAREAKELLTDAVKRKPQVPQLRNMLAQFCELTNDPGEALNQYKEAERLDRGNVPSLTRIAWIQSTTVDSELRNGQSALQAARRAVAATKSLDVGSLDSLAAAFAETGDFTNAISNAELAIKLAEKQQHSGLLTAIKQRLDLYRLGKPFRTEHSTNRSPQSDDRSVEN